MEARRLNCKPCRTDWRDAWQDWLGRLLRREWRATGREALA